MSLAAKLNWLRAAVLGANDGIVSVAGVVIGIAAVNPANTSAIGLAGSAALLAGAFSMSVGEYVSVSTQRDTESSAVTKTQALITSNPQAAQETLAKAWQERGVSAETARQIAAEQSRNNALEAHLAMEYQIDAEDLTNPWHAALSSFIAFTFGALLPLLAVLIVGPNLRIGVTFVATLIGLALTGWLAAKLGEADAKRAVIRVVIGGALAMAATFAVGSLLGVAV